MSAPVFLVEPGDLASAEPGGDLLLGGSEGRHAGVVQRRAPGERVDVVDGAGVRVRATVEGVTPDGVVLRVVERVVEPAPAVRLVLVQALAKGDRDEMAIEAATEVGADGVVPWQAERSVVVWRGERAAKSRARWVGTVRAAAKQSRRARVPDVDAAVDTAGSPRGSGRSWRTGERRSCCTRRPRSRWPVRRSATPSRGPCSWSSVPRAASATASSAC